MPLHLQIIGRHLLVSSQSSGILSVDDGDAIFTFTFRADFFHQFCLFFSLGKLTLNGVGNVRPAEHHWIQGAFVRERCRISNAGTIMCRCKAALNKRENGSTVLLLVRCKATFKL